MICFRQGDVLIRSARIPKSAKVTSRGRTVLAEGEVTGHAHVLDGPQVVTLTDAERVFVRIMAPAEIRHEEHGSIAIPPGSYRVIRQREYLAPALTAQVLD